MLAVSTTWNFDRRGGLRAAVAEIAELGYEGVELRAQGAVPDLAEAGEFCREKRVRCRSVHLPLTPFGWSGGDPSRELASPDEASRARAVAAALLGLPAAAAARAEILVLHLGEVEVPEARSRQRRWLAAALEGPPPGEEVAAALAERRALRDAHLEAAARSLFDLRRAAPEVVFALESRLHFHEIPDLEEVELLVSDAGGRGVAYWHDTGHVHLQGMLGIADPLAWLERHGRHTAGLHLHDVAGGTDHLPPGAGEVDWVGTRELAGSGMLRVLEVHGRHSAAELALGADHLRSLGLA